MYWTGSKPFTSQAKSTAKPSVSNCVIGPAPDAPAISAAQLDSTSLPSGVTAPRPVMTTLRLPLGELNCASHSEAAVDEEHGARDERGLVGAEEAYRPGHVLRVAQPLERRRGEHRARRLLRQHVGQLRLHVARRDDVRAHVAAAELAGEG